MDGRPVRLAGQDTRRGTFVQRFATIVDRKSGAEWTPLAHLSHDQANFYVYDSLLSEYAAMGFEYGYSVAGPDALVLWEAQFGDFVNGAQTVDRRVHHLRRGQVGPAVGRRPAAPARLRGSGPGPLVRRGSSGSCRWRRRGVDGAQPSTPASYFHLLRAHALGERHRPLIVFTPKSMLRSKAAVSSPDDFTTGAFQPVIPDTAVDRSRSTASSCARARSPGS